MMVAIIKVLANIPVVRKCRPARDFYHIEDPDLHNLAVRKASSLLLISLVYQSTCKYTGGIIIIIALKSKGSTFLE
jgi:hypothetical protein